MVGKPEAIRFHGGISPVKSAWSYAGRALLKIGIDSRFSPRVNITPYHPVTHGRALCGKSVKAVRLPRGSTIPHKSVCTSPAVSTRFGSA